MPIVKASNIATYGGSCVAVLLGGMNANEIAALGGLAVAVVGLIVGTAVNIWYKSRLLDIAEKAGKLPSGE